MRTAYISHPSFLRHEVAEHHPESPARLHAVDDRLIASGVMDLLRHYEAPPATREQLLRVHAPEYVERVEQQAPASGMIMLDADTPMGPHTLEAARRAAGAVVHAVDLVMAGKVENAFCGVRPPGHHAEPDKAMGFCIFNNAAVGIAHALAHHGLERVAIVDFDVHQGNGTEAIFRNEPRVRVFSSFQHPWYPFCDISDVPENTVLAPLKAGCGGTGFRNAVSNIFLPALDDFAPQMIFISAGFDAHVEDDMGQLGLTEADYMWITRELMNVAARHCENRIVSVLEGGYEPNPLGRCVTSHVRVLLG
ncbi:MAG: histone deacetylase family protein [Gammaproteobacteria bacterium]|nr:histone deacetylase family protein [Gammaproteobacteria bacterium]